MFLPIRFALSFQRSFPAPPLSPVIGSSPNKHILLKLRNACAAIVRSANKRARSKCLEMAFNVIALRNPPCASAFVGTTRMVHCSQIFYAIFKSLQRKVAKLIKEDKFKFYDCVASEAATAFEKFDSRTYYQAIKRLLPQKVKSFPMLIKNDVPASTALESRSFVQQHFASLTDA